MKEAAVNLTFWRITAPSKQLVLILEFDPVSPIEFVKYKTAMRLINAHSEENNLKTAICSLQFDQLKFKMVFFRSVLQEGTNFECLTVFL